MTEILTISSTFVKDLIVPRLVSSKKGDNGVVLVVGGNKIYHGAPILASMAALKSGTDLVYTAVPRSIILPIRSFSPNLIALPLPDDKLTIGSANKLIAMMPKKADSAAIGMGMTAKQEALIALIRQLKNMGTKLLLDASALIPEVLKEISGTSTIITPHPGEYKRIFGEEAGTTQKEQISNIDRLSKEYGITIILKGPANLVCSSEENGHVAVVKRSTPAMTVGGTGDVLAGLTAGLLTKLKPFDSCVLGVYFNGLAASLAYRQVGLHMVATDLIEYLPKVMKTFDKIKV